MDFQRLLHSPEGVVLRKQKEIICDFYRHVQREIQALEVINPFSSYLSFNATTHQARRDHQKYLTLINTITLLNQHQREKIYKDGKLCVKTHPIDIAESNFLARFIFASSLEELPPQTMNFMKDLVKYFIDQAQEKQIEFDHLWFYRKETRKLTGLSNTRSHEHLDRMINHELLTTRRDQNGIAYRFLYKPDTQFHVDKLDRLKLVRMAEILRHASKKERQEYETFKPSLEQIFKALDPKYKGEGI